MLIDFFIDFETRSKVDIKKVGGVRYAMHPSTEPTRITWCFGRVGTVKIWRRGEPVPQELIHVAHNPQLYRFIAQNTKFDWLIWTVKMPLLIEGLITPPISNIDDLRAYGSYFRLGESLEAIATMLRLNMSKDKEGQRLMRKQASPGRNGEFVELTPEEAIAFDRYAIMDTKILRDAYYRCPPMPFSERWAWEWTFARNMAGIRVDVAFIQEIHSIIESNMPRLVQEFFMLTGGVKISSPIATREFFSKYYPNVEDMRADTVRDLLASNHPVPPNVRRALELKELAGSTSISKAATALRIGYGDRIYETLEYSFAQTKRWAGRGVQIQNYPRPEDPDKAIDKYGDIDLNVHDLIPQMRTMRPFLKDPMGFVKNLLRRMWLPDEGEIFYCGDYSKIEPTVLFWLLDLGPIPDSWYEEMAAVIYNKRPEEIEKGSVERDIGKMANLSCQYGTGWDAFVKAVYKVCAILLNEEMARKIVDAYRKKNKEIVAFWYQLEDAFRKAIHGQNTVLCNGKIHVFPLEAPWKGVCIRLPSGGHLFYHNAKESFENFNEEYYVLVKGVKEKRTRKVTRKVLSYEAADSNGRIIKKYVYGGLLTEHVASATSREILVHGMYNVEQGGFKVLASVHDEIWASAPAGRGIEFTRLMNIRPSWCQDMEINCDRFEGVRYLK